MGNSTSSRDRRRTFEAAPPPYSTSDVKTRQLAGTSLYGAWAGDHKEARLSVESLDVAEASDAALHTLKDYDIVFIVDDSSSMKNDRWNRTRQALSGLVEAVHKYTPNGVDIVFINSKVEARGLKTVDDVMTTFQSVNPTYGTPLGKRLDEVLSEYTLRLQESRKPVRSSIFRTVLPKPAVRGVNYLIITDGDPTDDPLDVIVRNAKWLDENRFPLSQVGIQFVQIGRNRKAKEFLRKLDDDISNENQIRDMVDTYPYDKLGGVFSEEVLKNILLGGINRKEDNAH